MGLGVVTVPLLMTTETFSEWSSSLAIHFCPALALIVFSIHLRKYDTLVYMALGVVGLAHCPGPNDTIPISVMR